MLKQITKTISKLNIFKRSGQSLLSTPNGKFFWNLFGSTTSGINVTPQTALSYSAVFACVKRISDDIASLPFSVYISQGENKKKGKEHDQYYLLSKRPNRHYSKTNYFKTLIANYLLWGNGYAYIIRHQNSGRPISYQILKSEQVKCHYQKNIDGTFDHYYLDYENRRVIDPEDMIHITDFSLDGVQGISRIHMQRETISQGIAAVKYASEFYERGSMLSGIVESTTNLTNEKLKQAQSTFNDNYANGEKTGTVGFLPSGMTFKPLQYSMPMTDAQYIESRKFTVEEIARIFGVPPHKIGHLEKSTFNNIEEQGREYVQDTLIPIMTLLEEEHEIKALRINERHTHSMAFDESQLLRGNAKARAELYRTLMDRATLSPNDVLRREGMPTFAGGDVRWLPLNMVPLDKFGDVEFRKGLIDEEEE